MLFTVEVNVFTGENGVASMSNGGTHLLNLDGQSADANYVDENSRRRPGYLEKCQKIDRISADRVN